MNLLCDTKDFTIVLFTKRSIHRSMNMSNFQGKYKMYKQRKATRENEIYYLKKKRLKKQITPAFSNKITLTLTLRLMLITFWLEERESRHLGCLPWKFFRTGRPGQPVCKVGASHTWLKTTTRIPLSNNFNVFIIITDSKDDTRVTSMNW